jgi:transcriptional regulator with XRE-family HTH domain
MEFNKGKFAFLLKEATGERSLNEYAKDCGVSVTYISRLVRSLVDKAPGVEVIKKFAAKASNNITYINLMTAAGHINPDEELDNTELNLYGLSKPGEVPDEFLYKMTKLLRQNKELFTQGDKEYLYNMAKLAIEAIAKRNIEKSTE